MFFFPKGLFSWVFFPKGLFGCVFALRGSLEKFWAMEMLPCFDPMKCPDFGTDFRLEKEGIWTSVLHVNCSCNFELDVRHLNQPNWTSIAQVIAYFPGLPQATLF